MAKGTIDSHRKRCPFTATIDLMSHFWLSNTIAFHGINVTQAPEDQKCGQIFSLFLPFS